MYLIDSNIVIGTWNTYPPAIFRTLWDEFAALIPGGDLYFHKEVKKELTTWASEQSDWFTKHVPNDRVIEPNQCEVEKYIAVSHWAQFERTPKLVQKAVDDFLGVADSWLVACAMAHGATIVSDEKSAPQSRTRVKLPDAAAHFGVPYLNFLEFLQEKKLSF